MTGFGHCNAPVSPPLYMGLCIVLGALDFHSSLGAFHFFQDKFLRTAFFVFYVVKYFTILAQTKLQDQMYSHGKGKRFRRHELRFAQLQIRANFCFPQLNCSVF